MLAKEMRQLELRITMVRKVSPEGDLCPKCGDVTELLKRRGCLEMVNRVLDASPKDPEGEGMRLAQELKVKRAPFFVVEYIDGGRKIYTSVLQMLKELQIGT